MSSGIRRLGKKPANVRRAGIVPRPAPQTQASAQPVETRASTDYTLMSSTRTRTHNVMRFLSPTSVDLTTFTPPVKMRRRNRDYFRLKNKKRNEERQGSDLVEETVDAEPELDTRPKADMNLIADVGGARRNKRNLFKKKTKQVYFADEEKRRLDIEEARPWVLEDDDESQVWTGDLEGGQTASAYVLFVLADDGFRVVPVDRWYKFAPKLKYRTMTLDEAEEELTRMQKSHAKRDLWIMRRNAEPEQETDAPAPAPLVEYEANVFGSDSDHDSDSAKKAKKPVSNKHGAADEIEFEMEFDDDEELGDVRFEFNEEEAGQERGPTAFYAETDDEEDEPVEGKEAKALKKLVRKREDKGEYASDREENPYLSEESESESDTQPEADANPADVKPEPLVKPEAPAKPGATESVAKPVPRASTSSTKKRKRPLAPVDTRPKHKPTSVITQQEIVDLIRSGVSTTKDLITHVRKKLKADPQNKHRIHAILKLVATLKDNQLMLKKPFA